MDEKYKSSSSSSSNWSDLRFKKQKTTKKPSRINLTRIHCELEKSGLRSPSKRRSDARPQFTRENLILHHVLGKN